MSHRKCKFSISAYTYLCEFPHDRYAPADAVVPDDERFHAPAPVVPEGEPVKVTPEPLEGDVVAVDAVLLLGVDRVVGHARIEPHDYRPNGSVVL